MHAPDRWTKQCSEIRAQGDRIISVGASFIAELLSDVMYATLAAA
jgi:hypothetical protein